MILNSSLNAAQPSAAAQILPIGKNSEQPREALVQNSSLKTIESLSSADKSTLRLRERSASDPLANSPSGIAEPESESGSDERVSRPQDDQRERAAEAREKQQLLQEQRQIQELSARDREVRAHEQAHAAVGGQYAGAPTYEFERGPDGVRYAVGGEVSIDTGKAATPEETVRKAQVVRRAALAPAEPSPQDRRVAAQASRMENEARAEIAAQRIKESSEADKTSETEEEKEAPNGLSEEVTGESSRALESPRSVPRASSSAVFGQPQISSNSPQVSQILSVADVNTNRPGALLSQLV